MAGGAPESQQRRGNRQRQAHEGLQTQTCDGPDGKCLAVKLGGEVSDLSEAMRVALQRGTSRIIGRLAGCVGEGVTDGSLPGDRDAHHTAQTLYEMWLGATLLSKIRRDRSALDGAMAATRQWLKLPAPVLPAA